MTSKLVTEAIRVYSYQLARDMLDKAVLSVDTIGEEEKTTEKRPNTIDPSDQIQKEDLPACITPVKHSTIVGEGELATLLLARQLAEKETIIQQLRMQLETLQMQMVSLQRSSVPLAADSVQPVKRRMRSLHQVKDRSATNIKVNEEDVDSCSDKVFLSRKSSLESIRSHRSTSSKDVQNDGETHKITEKTPSLCDLQIQSAEPKPTTAEIPVENPPQPSKPNIFNVEYEEFAQQLKFELSPSTPSESHKTPDEFTSPDFRRKESKPVMNWSNLPSPRDTSGTSLHPDSLALKEAEKDTVNSVSIWTEMKPKGKVVLQKRGKQQKTDGNSINLDLKVRAKSQSHGPKQGKVGTTEEVFRKIRAESGPRSAGISKGRRSTPGSKGYSPRVANMNQTAISFPTTQKEIKPSSSFRQRKFSSKTRIPPEDSTLPPRKALDELLYAEENSVNWSHIMQQMKANPSFISKLINEGSESHPFDEEKRRETRLIFTKIPPKPVKPAAFPAIDKWGSDNSGRDLNCVLEEDEDSSRSHMDPLPELCTASHRSGTSSIGPLLKPGKKQPSSAPKPRPGTDVNADWSESPLDAFVLGGTVAFNWDKRPSVFTERELDVAYLKLRGGQMDSGEVRTVVAKGKQTVSRLMGELMLREEVGTALGTTVEAGVGLVKEAKRLLTARKATVRILELIHQREDQLLTLMSIEDEESTEGAALSQSISAINSEILTKIAQWKSLGLPYPFFRYLNSVLFTQNYAQKVEEEATSQFSMKFFGFP